MKSWDFWDKLFFIPENPALHGNHEERVRKNTITREEPEIGITPESAV